MDCFKPLLSLGQEKVLEHIIINFRYAEIDKISVVVGHKAELATRLLEHHGAQRIFNERYPEGMYSSVQAGVENIDREVGAFFILPGDIPLVKKETLTKLVQVNRETQASIVYPCYRGKRGHPPLISSTLLPEILGFSQAGGLRVFLAQYESQACEVDCDDEGILLDMDTEEDYKRILAMVDKEDIPNKAACLEILAQNKTDGNTIAHCRKVAEVALEIASMLNNSGLNLKKDLIRAGGLLHDLAKGERNHAGTGARRLHEMGYSQLAYIVGSHVDIFWSEGRPLNETSIVYLADKLVRGTGLVELDERFRSKLEKYSGNPDILGKVEKRLGNAKEIKKTVERHLGGALKLD